MWPIVWYANEFKQRHEFDMCVERISLTGYLQVEFCILEERILLKHFELIC